MAITSFGGPQANLAMVIDLMVRRRGYLTEEELMELNALCGILPGPASTQIITAIGYRVGGPNLAYLSLLVWVLPAVSFMTLAAIGIAYLQKYEISLGFTRFLEPMAVGFVAFAAYKICVTVVKGNLGIVLMMAGAVLAFFFRSPYVLPFLLIFGGLATSYRFRRHEIEEKGTMEVNWANFILWASVLVVAAALGGITHYLPLRLFENFYRNGSLIFGGGQVLVPLLYTEFVEFKSYLTSQEFLAGYAISKGIPGPTFAFSSYIGALSMRDFGIGGKVLGGFLSAAGIFLPGTFLIFFVVRFWEQLKRYRVMKASLEGINAVSSGLVVSAAIIMFEPMPIDAWNIGTIIVTLAILLFTRIPVPFIILAALVAGMVI